MNIDLPDDYKLTAGEIDNIVYLICKYTVQWPARSVDIHIMSMMLGEARGKDAVETLVQNTCEYVWDHICGEPDEPTTEMLVEHIKPMIEEWFSKTTQEERSVTA